MNARRVAPPLALAVVSSWEPPRVTRSGLLPDAQRCRTPSGVPRAHGEAPFACARRATPHMVTPCRVPHGSAAAGVRHPTTPRPRIQPRNWRDELIAQAARSARHPARRPGLRQRVRRLTAVERLVYGAQGGRSSRSAKVGEEPMRLYDTLDFYARIQPDAEFAVFA